MPLTDFPTHLGFKICCGIWGIYSMLYMTNNMDYKIAKLQLLHKQNQYLENKSQNKLR